jgi:hypothetical protein
MLNSEASVPVIEIVSISRSASPVFEMVKVWGAEVVPTFTLPKSNDTGLTEMSGAG